MARKKERVTDRQGFQPGEAGMVEKWDPIQGRWRTMQELADERQRIDEQLAAVAEQGRRRVEELERRKKEGEGE